MKRRTFINNRNLYDKLLEFNYRLLFGDDFACAKEYVTDEYQYDEDKNRCATTAAACGDKKCKKCLQELLNEEV